MKNEIIRAFDEGVMFARENAVSKEALDYIKSLTTNDKYTEEFGYKNISDRLCEAFDAGRQSTERLDLDDAFHEGVLYQRNYEKKT